LIISGICYSLCAVTDIVYAIFYGRCIDALIKGNFGLTMQNILFSVFALLISIILYWIAIKSRFYYVRMKVRSYKSAISKSIFYFNQTHFEQDNEAFSMNILSNDVDTIENSYFSQIPSMVFYVASFCFLYVHCFL